jgi:hypothetical protein
MVSFAADDQLNAALDAIAVDHNLLHLHGLTRPVGSPGGLAAPSRDAAAFGLLTRAVQPDTTPDVTATARLAIQNWAYGRKNLKSLRAVVDLGHVFHPAFALLVWGAPYLLPVWVRGRRRIERLPKELRLVGLGRDEVSRADRRARTNRSLRGVLRIGLIGSIVIMTVFAIAMLALS